MIFQPYLIPGGVQGVTVSVGIFSGLREPDRRLGMVCSGLREPDRRLGMVCLRMFNESSPST